MSLRRMTVTPHYNLLLASLEKSNVYCLGIILAMVPVHEMIYLKFHDTCDFKILEDRPSSVTLCNLGEGG